jgi:ubiquinol-cytochrome c reductase cytochrome c subunit
MNLLWKLRRSAFAGPAALVAVSVAVFGVLAWDVPASGLGQAAGTIQVSTDQATIKAGEVLFDMHCESCHGVGGVGAKGPELLDVGPAAVDFFLSTGRMPLADPSQEPTPGPPYFNRKQIAEIVAYVNFLDVSHGTPGVGIPSVTPPCNKETSNCPTLSEGNDLFLMNCAQCHDASGAGGMLSHGYVIPSLRSATREQIAEAIRVGPRPMPDFGPGQLTDQQVSAIADYVYYLAHSGNRGGFGIANFGPVPEGFVAIIFGLGILLIVSRVIGNRG